MSGQLPNRPSAPQEVAEQAVPEGEVQRGDRFSNCRRRRLSTLPIALAQRALTLMLLGRVTEAESTLVELGLAAAVPPSHGVAADPSGMERSGFSAVTTISRIAFGVDIRVLFGAGEAVIAHAVEIAAEIERPGRNSPR